MTTLPRAHVELPVPVERGGPVPLGSQIAAGLREAVSDGRLAAGERLASSRALAASLGVSRTVVTSAYAQLYAEGWLDGRHGSGTYVAVGAPGPAAPASSPAPASLPAAASSPPSAEHDRGGFFRPAGHIQPRSCEVVGAARLIEMRPGIPWASGIDRAAWRRAWRLAGAVPPSASLDSMGVPALRAALAGHLRVSRAVRCTPDQILVTRGVAGSLRLLAAALLRPGDRVAIEDPGYPAARAVFAAHGARIVACRADEHGLVVSELPGDVRLVYTTPAHQYPLGGRLPVPRRQQLIAWARATGALVVEDDYDSEFRYDVAPLPALFGLDPEVVVHLGTTTKTLTPALGVGWLVARPGLVAEIAVAAASLGERTSQAAQHAFLALLDSGEVGRHVRRMRREYARRRAVIVTALGAGQGPGRLLGDTAGLHVVLELPGGTADQVAAAALERGVAVMTLQRYFAGRQTRHGLVLGYGGASLGQVSRACEVLRELLAALPGGSAGAGAGAGQGAAAAVR
jgi:GntR family transcriptional regulator / MocR family aminotransferase